MFRAILLERQGDRFDAALRELDESALPAHDVTLRIEYSSLNYKDALAITQRGPVVRNWPMVPGIDGAGVVEHSAHPEFSVGDRVILNGWGAGEQHWGCLAERARLKSEWLVPLPDRLDTRTAMAVGTAGYTAMLCVQALERQRVRPDDGEILVTGAAGGVGSVAISLLAGRGFRVVASTGRADETDYLKRIGAAEVIDRAQLSAPGKPLGKERWAGVVDSVGSHTLVNACATTRYGGVVTACGLAQGMDLPGTVAPFILRGVSLIGIDSVMAPRADRLSAWQHLSQELDRERLAEITREIPLAATLEAAGALLAGGVRGRTVVKVDA
ncbi:acrylyl-CoA reductase (NADPH) [Variovorax sp. JS1663]|uniref:acrylyl-CoA reductase (NADPH) n=1 Tax=Variovorax sp. JS1663 TaxID=1851577 RepID=UPI000B3438CB|nr:MDR family oxidoreductase [Variovorax sp. JS1663]OUM03660.1 alcohol dehydrogenase [Variovorax sp. JS1663]